LRGIFFTSVFLLAIFTSYSQTTIVTGKVTEAATGSPVPFANVIFTGTQEGAITDFDGNFTVKTNLQVSSLEVRYVGFLPRQKEIFFGSTQSIDFQLDEDIMTLGEVVVYAGENPAFEILRKLVDNKKANDKRTLEAFEYESYTKVEFDVDNISDKFKNRKIVKKIRAVLDSIQQLAGDDGQPILPVFLSEAISRYYFRSNPTLKHEHILKTKVSGVGITDGTLTSQIIGSTFQEYNFYQNWLNIVGKEFVSPLTDGWKLYYEYDLIDSSYIDGVYCYQIDFFPKREQDLAFWGKMWVSKNDYALRRIDALVPKYANLNYIEKIKIQQDLIKTSAGPWLPEKTRVLVDIAQLTDNTAGMLAKFYVSTKDYIVNTPREKDFYLNPVSMDNGVRDFDDNYWSENRHDTLTKSELNVFQMIDTLKKMPVVKTYMELGKFAATGYIKTGKFDMGPYTTFLGNNDIEGVRLGFGGRTNYDFSKKWLLGGHFGYGFSDERWKYKWYVSRVLNREKWATIKYEQQKEIEQVWLLNENIEPNSLFYTLSRFGTLTQPFLTRKYRLSYEKQLATGFNIGLAFKHQQVNPLFDFRYYKDDRRLETRTNYNVSEATLKLRYAKDEIFVVNDNERLSLGTVKWPAFNIEYTYGLNGFLGSDFEYHKVRGAIEKRLKMGLFGVSKVRLTGGIVFGKLPYTLLYNPIGNETPFYVGFAYNLMDFFEFSTDRYADLRYRHSFEGLILNRIPLMKKLKWRMIGSANALYGSIKESNINTVVLQQNDNGEEIVPFSRLERNKPYVELGYGIENIFKVFSVEAFHRITYLDNPNVNKFAVKFNIQIIL
jgi:hypothetical protein